MKLLVGDEIMGKTEIVMVSIGINGIETIVIERSLAHDYNIRESLKNSEIVFISTGLYNLYELKPIVDLINKIDALSVFILPEPFHFGNKDQPNHVESKLREIEKEFDVLLIPRADFASHYLQRQTLYKNLDDTTASCIEAIANTVISKSPNDINLDYNDLKIVLRGRSFIGTAEYIGEGAISKAIEAITDSYSFRSLPLGNITKILVSFKTHPNCSMAEMNDGMKIVENTVDEDADIAFGTISDVTFPFNYVRVTVVASFFKE